MRDDRTFAAALGKGPRQGAFSSSRVSNIESGRSKCPDWLTGRYEDLLDLPTGDLLWTSHFVQRVIGRRIVAERLIVDADLSGTVLDKMSAADAVTISEWISFVNDEELLRRLPARMLEDPMQRLIASLGQRDSDILSEHVIALGSLAAREPAMLAGLLGDMGASAPSYAVKAFALSRRADAAVSLRAVSSSGDASEWVRREADDQLASLYSTNAATAPGATHEDHRHDDLLTVRVLNRSGHLKDMGPWDPDLEEWLHRAQHRPSEQGRREARAVLSRTPYVPGLLAEIVAGLIGVTRNSTPRLVRLAGPLAARLDPASPERRVAVEALGHVVTSQTGQTGATFAWEAAKSLLDLHPIATEDAIQFLTGYRTATDDATARSARMSLVELAVRSGANLTQMAVYLRADADAFTWATEVARRMGRA